MTTTVKVEAHCSTPKEVTVEIDNQGATEKFVLQDGESGSYVVYDLKTITVKEVNKAN